MDRDQLFLYRSKNIANFDRAPKNKRVTEKKVTNKLQGKNINPSWGDELNQSVVQSEVTRKGSLFHFKK